MDLTDNTLKELNLKKQESDPKYLETLICKVLDLKDNYSNEIPSQIVHSVAYGTQEYDTYGVSPKYKVVGAYWSKVNVLLYSLEGLISSELMDEGDKILTENANNRMDSPSLTKQSDIDAINLYLAKVHDALIELSKYN